MRTLVVLHNILYRHTSRVSVPASTTTTRTVSTLASTLVVCHIITMHTVVYMYIYYVLCISLLLSSATLVVH